MDKQPEDLTLAAVEARYGDLVRGIEIKGIEGAASATVILTPFRKDAVDIAVKGVSDDGYALSHSTRLQRTEHEPSTVHVDATGQGWSWGDFMQDRDRPDFTAEEIGEADTGMDEAKADALCRAVASAAADYALANPLALMAAEVLLCTQWLSMATGQKAMHLQKAAEITESMVRREARQAILASELDALLETQEPSGPTP